MMAGVSSQSESVVSWVATDQVVPLSALVLYQISPLPERSETHTTQSVPSAVWAMDGV